MPQPTVEQVLNITEKSELKNPSKIGSALAYFLFPPWGIYLFWKEKALHQFFAILSAVFGAGMLATILIALPDAGSQMFLAAFIALLSCVQIVFSLIFAANAKRKGYLNLLPLVIMSTITIALLVLITIFSVNLIANLFQQEYQGLPGGVLQVP